MTLHIPFVESESELLDVLAKRPFGNVMKSPINSAFKNGPDCLDAVAMMDGLVLVIQMPKAIIAAPFIRVDGGAAFDAIQDREFESSSIRPFHRDRFRPDRRARACRECA